MPSQQGSRHMGFPGLASTGELWAQSKTFTKLMQQKAIKKTTEGELRASAHLYTHMTHVCEYAYIHTTQTHIKIFSRELGLLTHTCRNKESEVISKLYSKERKCKLVEIHSEK